MPRLIIGEFVIDRSARRLLRDRTSVRIQHKPLDVLIHLVENRSRLVTRGELLHKFWPRRVNEEALTRCISTIRKQLEDSQDPPQYIETLWGQGYRFIEKVTELPADSHTSAATSRSASNGDRSAFVLEPAKHFGIWLAALVGGLLLALTIFLAWRSPTADSVTEIERIAVLPISAPDHEEWVVSAMTDELIQAVSRIEGIAVMARGSVARFSATSDPLEIGRLLSVEAILVSKLELRQGYEYLRSSLVSTRDGSVLWNFQAEPSAGSTEEEQIHSLANAAARRLWANLHLNETPKRVQAAAYRHYLRGRYYWGQRSLTGLSAAIDAFDAALELEPEYAAVMTGLAESWLLLPLYGAVEPNEAVPRAREMAERALSLDATQSHAHAVLGVIHMQYDWDWFNAEKRLIQAVALNPNDSTAVQWLGELYCYSARFDECRRYLSLAAGLDPLSPILKMLRGSADLWSGRYEVAVDQYLQTMREIPDFIFAHVGLGHALMGLRDWDQAIESYETMLPDYGLEIVGGPLIYAHARRGNSKKARQLLDELALLAQERYVPPSKLAVAHLGLGDTTRALEYLRKAVEAHDDRLVYLAVDSMFMDLHGNPEFLLIAGHLGIIDALEKRWGVTDLPAALPEGDAGSTGRAPTDRRPGFDQL